MKKTFAAALAALALVGAMAASTSNAEARRWHRGFGFGIGVGLVLPGDYVYDDDTYYVEKCRYVERYNRRGEYIGVRKVCRVLPY